MAIVQKNTFVVGPPAQNLTNLGLNVDANRLNDDKTFITVDFSGSPAEVTIEIGSAIEVNENLYTIESADEVITMDNATDNYIIFDGTTFSTAPTIGTWSTAKQGYYQADNVSRTLKWFVDQDLEWYDIKLFDTVQTINTCRVLMGSDQTIAAAATATMIFDTIDYDFLGSFNTGTYTFTAPEYGVYFVNLSATYNRSINVIYPQFQIYKNSSTIVSLIQDYGGDGPWHSSNLTDILLLNKNDTLIFRLFNDSPAGSVIFRGGTLAGSVFFNIARIV